MIDMTFRQVVRDRKLEHQIDFEVSPSDDGLGVVVTCNCRWESYRNPVDLDDAWILFWEHAA